MKTARPTRTIAGVALLLAAAALSACVTTVAQPPRHVPPPPRAYIVPSVEGMALEYARAELEDAGYRLGRVSKERERHAPPGSVLWQDPEPYTKAPRGTYVDVVIAARSLPDAGSPPYHPDLTSVPDLRGLKLKPARRALKRADLRLGDVTEDHARNAPPGTVIWQGPAPARRVKPGSAVNVVIARAKPDEPSARTTVPKLRGLTLKDARDRLRRAELRLGQVTERAEANARRGTVIAQDPKPRREVRRGTAVDLVIVGGQQDQPSARTTVPKLRGLTLKDARDRLRRAELRLGQVTERAEANARRGTVIAQDPKPRREVRRGTAVDLVIVGGQQDQPSARTTVPKLRGLTLEDARAKVSKAGLRLGQITAAADNNTREDKALLRTRAELQDPSGTVLAQSPDPGARVRRGAAVDVVVSIQPHKQGPER